MGNNQLKARSNGKNLEIESTNSDSPILPVQHIERLHQLNPDWSQWVFDQTTIESTHRRSERKRVNTFVFVERIFSTFCALLVVLAAFSVTAYCAYIEQPIPASIIGGTTLVGLVTAFIAGRKPSKNE